FSPTPRPPRPTLFPYTPLFRSRLGTGDRLPEQGGQVGATPADPGILRPAQAVLPGRPRVQAAQHVQQRGGVRPARLGRVTPVDEDRKSTRLNSSHVKISYAVFC